MQSSRFFAGSSSESEEEVEEEIIEQVPDAAAARASRRKGWELSSSDEEEKRMVKTAKERFKDEIKALLDTLKASIKDNKWIELSKCFEDLQKHYTKGLKTVYKERPSWLFISALNQLEEAHNAVWSDKEKQSGFSSSVAKAFNAMRQNLRKYIQSFDSHIKQLRENPSLIDEPDYEDQPSSESDSETEPTPAVTQAPIKAEDVNDEVIDKKLDELIQNRRRRGANYERSIYQLRFLEEHTTNSNKKVKILAVIIVLMYDSSQRDTEMRPTTWKRIAGVVSSILNITEANQSIVVDTSEELADTKFGSNDETQPAAEGAETAKISTNLLAFVERLEDDLVRSLQFLDPHSQDYESRLLDEIAYVELASRAQKYYSSKNMMKHASRLASKRLEHTYYKREKDFPESAKVVPETASIIYKHGDERIRYRAILCQIYHHAINDRFQPARDLMVMSRMQDLITQTDIPTQIMFNRAMVQIGMCAFRNGKLQEAQACLNDICNGARSKELLAQGIASKYVEKTPEQEKAERRRQIPYHMHINLELLESVHLLTCVLLELPPLTASKSYQPTKSFRRLLDYSERQVFSGPPENVRDHMTLAMKYMGSGDWRAAFDIVMKIKSWNLIPNFADVKPTIQRKIQEETLRTYLFTYNTHYSSIKLEKLVALFDLEANQIHSIISRMIINDELVASWDQPTESLVVHCEEPTKLQHLALTFADKLSSFVESNERLLESRSGSATDDNKQRKQGRNDEDFRQNRFRRQQGRPVLVPQPGAQNRRPRRTQPNQTA